MIYKTLQKKKEKGKKSKVEPESPEKHWALGTFEFGICVIRVSRVKQKKGAENLRKINEKSKFYFKKLWTCSQKQDAQWILWTNNIKNITPKHYRQIV